METELDPEAFTAQTLVIARLMSRRFQNEVSEPWRTNWGRVTTRLATTIPQFAFNAPTAPTAARLTWSFMNQEKHKPSVQISSLITANSGTTQPEELADWSARINQARSSSQRIGEVQAMTAALVSRTKVNNMLVRR